LRGILSDARFTKVSNIGQVLNEGDNVQTKDGQVEITFEDGAVLFRSDDLLTLGALANQIVLQQKQAEPAQIARGRQYIEDNYQEEFSLADVARHAGMCPSYFCKRFKRVTGVHFTHYVSRFRVEKAKTLLLNHNYRISEIAFEVGFQSLTHFNRVFKHIAGQSPTSYREQLVAA